MVFCCFLPETNARRPAWCARGLRTLGLGPVKAQLDAFGRGVGHHVGQGPKAHARPAWDGEAAPGQQGSDLMDGTGDGGAVHPVQHPEGVVGQLEAQDHQGSQDSVGEDQLVVGPGPGGTLAWMAAALVQGALVGGGPRIGQLGDQLPQVLPRQAGEDRMGEGRTGPCWRRHPTRSPVRSVSRPPGDPGHNHPRPHVAELRSAIVHSGCYNRTLTPDGSSTNGEATGPSPMSTTRSARCCSRTAWTARS
jgi:hypothetical protein